MKLDFKRIMSSVLAFVMLFSSLVMVNVVSVSAAPDIWNSSDSSAKDWLLTGPDNGCGTFSLSGVSSATTKKSSFAEKIFADDTSNVIGDNKGYKFGSASPAKPSFKIKAAAKTEVAIFVINDNSSNGTLSVKAGEEGSITIDASNSGKNEVTGIVVPSGRPNNKETTDIAPVKLTLDKADTYAFSFGTSGNYMFRIELDTATSGGGDDSSYTWTIDPKNLTGNLSSTDKSVLHVANEKTIGKRNTLVYTGTDYTLMPKYSHLYEGLNVEGTEILKVEGYSITVTPTMDMFMKNVNIPKNNISIENGNNRILHLTCNHGATYSILLDDGGEDDIAHAKSLLESDGNGYYTLVDGIDLPMHDDVYTASIGGGTLTLDGGNEITINGSEVTISGRFEPYEELPITDSTDEINVFANLKTTAGARAERILTGTVLGTEENKFFHVVGPDRDFGNVYALSGTENEEEYGTDAFAVVIRSSSEYEDLKGGGIGFEISNNIPDGSKFTLEVKCTGVADPQSGGDKTTIGLAKLTEDSGTHVEKLGDPVGEPKEITQVQDSDKNPPSEAIKFENLEPGKYAIYNPGAADTTGNIRVYSMKLTKVDGEATSTTIVDALDPAKVASVPTVAKETGTAGGNSDGSGTNKFIITGESELQNAPSNKTLNIPGSSSITPTKIIYFSNDGDNTKRNISFTTAGDTSTTGTIYVFATSSNSTPRDYSLQEDGQQKVIIGEAGRSDAQPSMITGTIKGGTKYYLYADGKLNLYYVGSTIPLVAQGEEAKTYPVTISGTNNTGKTVTVNVMKGDQVAATASIPSDGTFTDVALSAELTAGEYTLSAKGFTFSPNTITVNAAEETTTQKIENITIDESKNVTVKFEMSDGTKPDDNIKITPTGSSAKTISKSNGEAVTFTDVAPGTQFKIESTAKNVWKWVAKNDKAVETDTYNWNTYADSRKYIKYDTDHLTYTIPDAASIDTTAEYGVTFTASSDMAKAAGSTDSLYVKNTASELSFGQYAFGDSKALDACGRSWARNYVKFKLTPLSLSDFSSKRTARYYNSLPDDPDGRTNNNRTKEIDNAYAALSQNTVPDGNVANATNYIEFTIDSDAKNNAEPDKDLTIQIDRDNGIDLYNMTDGNTKVNASAYIADSSGKKISKQEFPVKADKTYRIVASGYTYAKSGDASWEANEVLTEEPSGSDRTSTTSTVYVKSIRMFNPNNIFDGVQDEDTLVAPANEGKLSAINAEETALKKALTDANADISSVDQDATVFRIIGMLDLAGINGLDAGSTITREDLENAVANIAAVGYDVYEKDDYDLADTQGNYYHEGMNTTSHQPTLKESIEITDVVNTGYDLNGTEEDPQITGSIDPENLRATVFTQTFYATKESLTLVPWVKYAGNDTKVYSLVQKTDGSTSNNKELIVE